MNTIVTYQAAASRSGGSFFGMPAAQKVSSGIWQTALWSLQQTMEEAVGAKTSMQGGISTRQRPAVEQEASVRQSEQEHVFFAERVRSCTPEEAEKEKDLRKEKWEYINCFFIYEWSEAQKERIFGNSQVHLGGDGNDILTDEQIAYLRGKYDMRRLTGEDAYNFLCDLTEMNVFSSKDWAAMMIDRIQLELENGVSVLSGKDEGTWGWMLDEETGEYILVNSRSFYQDEEEEEDPALIKARVKGYTDDILLAAFCPEDKKEMPSPEELRDQGIPKEADGGIAGELEAMLSSGVRITEQDYKEAGFVLDVVVHKLNMEAEIKSITGAAYQAPEAAARLLPQYKKQKDACEKFLGIVEQVKRLQ